MNMKEHTRKTSVHFHPIGLSHVDRKQFSPRPDIYVTDNSTWNVMTLHSIMNLLGHTGVSHKNIELRTKILYSEIK
jgi:hypothetical protein